MRKALLKCLAVLGIALFSVSSFAGEEGFTAKIEPLHFVRLQEKTNAPGVDIVVVNYMPQDANAREQNSISVSVPIDGRAPFEGKAPAQASFRMLNPGSRIENWQVILKTPDGTVFFDRFVWHRATISVRGFSPQNVTVTDY